MGAVDIRFGAPLVASWFNAIMYMLMLVQAFYAWNGPSRHPLGTKILVALVVLIDTIGTAATCAQVYLFCVTLWGNLGPGGARSLWPYPVSIATTGVTALVVHAYLLRRLWKLSHNIVVVGVLTAVALLALGGAAWTSAILVVYPLVKDVDKWRNPSQIWIASSVVADVGLAIALVWKLHVIKTHAHFKRTHSLLRRCIVLAIETGGITSALFIVTLGMFMSGTVGSAAVAVELCLGRAYTNTLMYNLNLPQRLAGKRSGSLSASAIEDHTGITLSGIHVTTTVHLDNEQDASRSKPISDVERIKSPANEAVYRGS